MSIAGLTRPEFEARVTAAQPGEIIIYHIGFLMEDRERGIEFGKVANLAFGAMKSCEMGHVFLMQRRLEEGRYEYRAVKRAPPYKPIRWMGCYDTEPMRPHQTGKTEKRADKMKEAA